MGVLDIPGGITCTVDVSSRGVGLNVHSFFIFLKQLASLGPSPVSKYAARSSLDICIVKLLYVVSIIEYQ